jgi:hypothetical protein
MCSLLVAMVTTITCDGECSSLSIPLARVFHWMKCFAAHNVKMDLWWFDF